MVPGCLRVNLPRQEFQVEPWSHYYKLNNALDPRYKVGMGSAQFTNAALSELQVRAVERGEENRYQEQMARHQYLGALPKIGDSGP